MRAYLEISGLWHKPAVDELLRVFGKSKEEITVHLELINGFNRLMNLQQQTENVKHRQLGLALDYITTSLYPSKPGSQSGAPTHQQSGCVLENTVNLVLTFSI